MSFCRICLDDDTIQNLISPCRCNGTSKYVHYTCLEQWRVNNANPDAQVKCMECNAQYRIVNKYPMETFKVDYRKIFLFKTLLHPLFLILPTLGIIIGIESLSQYKTTKILDSIVFTNITYEINDNIFEYISYYFTLSSSFIYISFYLTFLFMFFLEIKRKWKYALHVFLGYLISFIVNTGYIYLYLIFSFNIRYYFVAGLVSPLIYYYTFHWFLKYFHNDMIDKLNNYYNKTKYLNYELYEGIVNPTFQETPQDNEVFLIENNEFNEPVQMDQQNLLYPNIHQPPPPSLPPPPPPIPPVDYDTFTPSFENANVNINRNRVAQRFTSIIDELNHRFRNNSDA